MKIMELGEIKQFPIFEMSSQNTKQCGEKLCVIYMHSHYGIYQQQSIQGRNIITTSAVSKSESLESCTSAVLNSIPKECHILGVCRAARGSAL